MASIALLTCLVLGGDPSGGLRVRAGADPTRVEVIARIPADLSARIPAGKLTQEQGEAWLRLTILDSDTGAEGAAMLGTFERRGDKLVFTPRFALLHDHRYRARFGPAGGKGPGAEYRVPPRPPSPPAFVEKVYPSADVLPANHLRFYLHFSRPMRGGQAIFDQIRILDANGEEVTDPWLRDELWDSDGRMLILYIHPGRIKWGILLRLLLGPVLEPGREYTLVLSRELLDADGRRLGKEFRKKFRTTAEDRVRVELSDWKVTTPPAGTTEPVALALPKSFDRLGLEGRVKVVDAAGKPVAGRVEIGPAERSWKFHPRAAWSAGAYRIRVEGELEDTAGNTPLSPFDVDLDTPKRPPQSLDLPFRPRTAVPTSGASARPAAQVRPGEPPDNPWDPSPKRHNVLQG
jgi:hypothetical protein